jgi:hypothetical protein
MKDGEARGRGKGETLSGETVDCYLVEILIENLLQITS